MKFDSQKGYTAGFAWEETWRSNMKVLETDEGDRIAGFDGGNFSEWGSERLRLASAAPEMARVLLDLLDQRFDSIDLPSLQSAAETALRKAGVRGADGLGEDKDG